MLDRFIFVPGVEPAEGPNTREGRRLLAVFFLRCPVLSRLPLLLLPANGVAASAPGRACVNGRLSISHSFPTLSSRDRTYSLLVFVVLYYINRPTAACLR